MIRPAALYVEPSGSRPTHVLYRQCSQTASGRERIEVPTANTISKLSEGIKVLARIFSLCAKGSLLTPQVAVVVVNFRVFLIAIGFISAELVFKCSKSQITRGFGENVLMGSVDERDHSTLHVESKNGELRKG